MTKGRIDSPRGDAYVNGNPRKASMYVTEFIKSAAMQDNEGTRQLWTELKEDHDTTIMVWDKLKREHRTEFDYLNKLVRA